MQGLSPTGNVGTYESQSASFSNVLYTYDIGPNGQITNIRPVILDSNGVPIGTELNNISSTNGVPNLLLLPNGAHLVNGSSQLTMVNGQLYINGELYTGNFYYTSDPTTGQNFRYETTSDGGTRVMIEDLPDQGDMDFNDLVVVLYKPALTLFQALDAVDGTTGNNLPPHIQDAYSTFNDTGASAEERAKAATVLLNYLQRDADADPTQVTALRTAQSEFTKAAIAETLDMSVEDLEDLDWSTLTPQQITAVFELLIEIGVIDEDFEIGDDALTMDADNLIAQALSGSPSLAGNALAQILGAISGALSDLNLTGLVENVELAQEEYQEFSNLGSLLTAGPARHPGGPEGWLADFEAYAELGGQLGLFKKEDLLALQHLENGVPTTRMYHDVRAFILHVPAGSGSGASGYGNWTTDFIGSTSLDTLFNELAILNEEIIAAVMNGDPVAKSRAETAKMILQMKIQLLMSLL